MEEVRRSLLVALIDRKITKYISNYDGIVKKFETDKYFIVIKNKYLKELQANRFLFWRRSRLSISETR